jgi:serine/threonine protein kinase
MYSYARSVADDSLSYLHTGSQLDGITYPIFWKSSPSKNHFAVISKCNPDEQTLQHLYFSNPDVKYRPPSTAKLCHLAIAIVQVLDTIHSRKVRHGHLRPEVINVWKSDGEYHCCIRDFTESSLLLENDTSISTSPESHPDQADPVGTTCLCYLPPELLSGSTTPGRPISLISYSIVDHRADFYSLGAVLYQLLKGSLLFSEHVTGTSVSAEAALEIAAAHRLEQPPEPTGGKDPLLDQLVLHLLEKNPDLRYQTGAFFFKVTDHSKRFDSRSQADCNKRFLYTWYAYDRGRRQSSELRLS